MNKLHKIVKQIRAINLTKKIAHREKNTKSLFFEASNQRYPKKDKKLLKLSQILEK